MIQFSMFIILLSFAVLLTAPRALAEGVCVECQKRIQKPLEGSTADFMRELVKKEAPKQRLADYISVGVTTEAMLDSSVDGGVDVNHSHMAVRLGKNDIQNILRQNGVKTFGPNDFMVNLTMKFSIVPMLLRDSTEATLGDKIDQKIDAKRPAIIAATTQKVDQALKADPKFAALPPEIQSQIRAKTLATAFGQVDAQLNAVRKSKKDVIHQRLNNKEMETAIQEVAVVLGKVADRGTALIFLKAGKFTPENGPTVDAAGKSELEQMRLVNSRTQRGSGTAATGAVDLGVQKILPNGLQIRSEIFFLHDRLPFVSGKDYIAAAASQSDEQFKKYEDWWKIDSAMLRMMIRGEKFDGYVTTGSHDGKQDFGAGVTLRLTPKDTVYGDYYRGGREYLGESFSAFYSHAFNKDVKAYVGIEGNRNAFQPAISLRDDSKVNSREAVAGASWTIVDRPLGERARMKWTVSGEAFDFNDLGSQVSHEKNGTGFRSGTRMDIKW